MSRASRAALQVAVCSLAVYGLAWGLLADQIVGGGKALAVKGRLAGRGQPDQDYALHVSIARG